MPYSYFLHFRQSDFPLIFTDIVFHPQSYGIFDYRALQIKDNVSAYLTRRGLRESYKFGRPLLKAEPSSKIIKDLERVNSELRDKNILNMVKRAKSSMEIVALWDLAESKIFDFSQAYRYCEQTVVAPLEKDLLKVCTEDQLIEILHKPSLIEKTNLSDDKRRIFQTLLSLGELKLSLHKNAESWVESLYIFSKFLAKKYNISLNQALSLRSDEFRRALRGKIISPDILNNRVGGCAFIPLGKGKRWRCLINEEFKYWQNRLVKGKGGIVKGAPAYPGKVKGIVVVHTSWTKSLKIPAGSVIVSGMTNPQIISALKNAAAIITEEGGLTCHAAIISRELKIPCIVGTGNATQVLKDGDRVEVDANKGIVIKIK
ncbi:MAG: PEP-utilizing enzyme [Patescibacteria group bacterium]